MSPSTTSPSTRTQNNISSDNHFGPSHHSDHFQQLTAMGKQHPETVEATALPPFDQPKMSSSIGSHPAHDEMPTEAEMSLLRKLRTLQGADYEAQYFDNKPNPNTNSQFGKMGNPTALALAVFAFTNTLLSLFMMRARGVKELNFLVGTLWFTAGGTNIICAIFELLIGNTFAWTIFGALGGYFLSMGALLTPAFGVTAAYAKHPEEFRNAMGLFNICWAIMFVVFLIVAFKTNIFMVLIFTCVAVTCVLTAMADFKLAAKKPQSAETYNKVAGAFLLLSAIPNWYLLLLILTASAGWPLRLPTGDLGIHAHGHGQGHEVGKKVGLALHYYFVLPTDGQYRNDNFTSPIRRPSESNSEPHGHAIGLNFVHESGTRQYQAAR